MGVMRYLTVFDRVLFKVMRGIAVSCFTLLMVLLVGNVLVRYVPFMSFHWFDEVVEWAFAWMIFIGAAALWMRNEHFKVEWISPRLKGTRIGHVFRIGIELISLMFLVVFTYQSFLLTLLAKDWTPVFHVTRRVMYVCMPIGGSVMVGYSLRNVVQEILALLGASPVASPSSLQNGEEEGAVEECPPESV